MWSSHHPFVSRVGPLNSVYNPDSGNSTYTFHGDTEGRWEVDVVDELEVDDDSSKVEKDPCLAEYQLWCECFTRALEGVGRKRDSLSNELKKAEKVEETMHRAQLLTSNMYMFTPGVTTATVQDWENDGDEVILSLDDLYESASAEADALFQKARKLRRGSAVVKDLLQETCEALGSLEEIEGDLKACLPDGDAVNADMLRLVQDRLIRNSRKTGFSPPADDPDADTTSRTKSPFSSGEKRKPALGTPASNVRKLTSPGGCIILVGRNRRGNEHLTFSVARGDDIWMQ